MFFSFKQTQEQQTLDKKFVCFDALGVLRMRIAIIWIFYGNYS